MGGNVDSKMFMHISDCSKAEIMCDIAVKKNVKICSWLL